MDWIPYLLQAILYRCVHASVNVCKWEEVRSKKENSLALYHPTFPPFCIFFLPSLYSVPACKHSLPYPHPFNHSSILPYTNTSPLRFYLFYLSVSSFSFPLSSRPSHRRSSAFLSLQVQYPTANITPLLLYYFIFCLCSHLAASPSFHPSPFFFLWFIFC